MKPPRDSSKTPSTVFFLVCFASFTCSLSLSPSAKLNLKMEAKQCILVMMLSLTLLSVARAVTSKAEVVSCTMCSSCDNPCTPVQSSPPPPSPPPPPPSPKTTDCPPPPSSGGGGGGGGSYYYPPPSGDGGQGYYYPPPYSGNYPTQPPPNPMVPYSPFYYHMPPTSGSWSYRFQSSCFFPVFSVLLCLL